MNVFPLYTEFLEKHIIKKISTGKSGVDVFELDDNRVAKYALQTRINDDSIWRACQKESQFFSEHSKREYFFLPEVYVNICNEQEFLILMKKYRPIERSELDELLLDEIMNILSKIHMIGVSDHMHPQNTGPIYFERSILEECVDGWESVLCEHGDHFDRKGLQLVKEYINPVNSLFYEPHIWFTHGDFHIENLLRDVSDEIIVCDWQSCAGGNNSGDISFFISRLSADGYDVDNRRIIETYCKCMEIMNQPVKASDIDIQIKLANVNVSFQFWHEYLHGNSKERVNEIYSKMIEDMQSLLNTRN